MTQSSLPEPIPTPRKPFWKKAIVPLGVLTIAGIGGTLWARKFIYEDIVPIVEASLKEELQRPIKLGKVESFSLSSLRLGKSEIPVTPTDSDHAEIDAIDVRFNLWESIQRKKLNIKVNLINPNVFIEEDKPGLWIGTEPKPPKPDENTGDVEVTEIKLTNATVELAPIPKSCIPTPKSPTTSNVGCVKQSNASSGLSGSPPTKKSQPPKTIAYKNLNAQVEILDKNKRFILTANGESATQGTFTLNAQAQDTTPTAPKDQPKPTQQLEINAQTRGNKLLLSEIDRLIRLPVDVSSGELNGNLDIKIRPNEKYPTLNGTGTFTNIAAKFPGVPYGVSKSNGEVKFDGKRVILEKSNALVANAIPVQTKGIIDLEKGVNLTAKTAPTPLPTLIKTFKLNPPALITGTVVTSINVTGPLDKPIVSGTVKNTIPITVANGDFKIDNPEANSNPGLSNQNRQAIVLKDLTTNFKVDTKSLLVTLSDLLVLPQLGGKITGAGTIALSKPEAIDLRFQATDLPGDTIATTYNGGKAIPTKLGPLSATVSVSGSPTNPNTLVAWNAPEAQYPANGEIALIGNTIKLQNTTAQVEGGIASINGTIVDGNIALNVKTDGIGLKKFSPELRGIFSSDLKVTGNIANLSPQTVRVAGTTRLSEGVAIIQDPIVADIEWTGKQLNINNASAPGLSVNGTVFAELGEKPDITGFDLNVKTQGLSLASLPANLPPDVKLSGSTDFDGKITGTPKNPSVNGNIALNALNVNGFKFDPLRGTIAFAFNKGLEFNVASNRDRISAKLDANLQPISANLRRGDSSVDAVRSGELFNVAIQNLNLDELNGFGLDKPIAAAIAQAGINETLGGTQLGGNLNGTLAVNLTSQQLQTGVFNINSPRLGNFRATSLTASLKGGSLTEINAASIAIIAPRLSNLFEANDVNVTVKGANILTGAIASANVTVNSPRVATFTAKQIIANLGSGSLKSGQSGTVSVLNPSVGTGRGEDFKAAFYLSDQKISLQKSTLRLPILDDRGNPTGEVGTIAFKGDVNLRGEPQVNAEMAVTDGRFEDVLKLAQVFNLEDLTRSSVLPTYGRASDVVAQKIDVQDKTLLQQLQTYAKNNQALSQIAETRQGSIFPSSLDIRGRFDSTVKIAGNPFRPDRFKADFSVKARNLEWRPYASYLEENSDRKLDRNPNRVLKAETAILEGGLDNGVLSIRPFILNSGDTKIRLSSVQIGAVDEQSGQLKIENLPVEAIQEFIPVPLVLAGQPLALTGKLNATVSLSGPRNKPNFLGSATLMDGTLNGSAIESANGSFNYIDGRVSFNNRIIANSSEPIVVQGELPIDLPLPTGTVSSPDRSVKIAARIKDDGLSLLNLLGQPIAWQGGKGQLNLDITQNDTTPLTVLGSLTLDGAQVKVQALPEPLTNVKGRIFANLSGIQVEELRGEFSKGSIVAQGTLPLVGFSDPVLPEETPPVTSPATSPATPSPSPEPLKIAVSKVAIPRQQPLTIALQKIAINLKGLYQGGVNGNLVVGGSVFSPRIGGKVSLTNGQVLLTDAPTNDLAAGGKTDGRVPFELSALNLTLGDNVRVVRAPIINFVARGNLVVNGTLDNPAPVGRIDLQAGQVNLFTTQFVLARGYRNFAEFRTELGLDPILDVRLVTAVPEITRTRIPTNNITSEIAESINTANTIGGVQTVRIQARANGPASLLTENLELKSSPSRSNTEIVALLGGGFINTLGRGDDATLGIANFAGSALLTNVQGAIGNALGLSEFRLFPTLIGNEKQKTSTLGLAAEAGIDLLRTKDGLPIISATIFRVLTVPNQNTQLGLRYRVNEQFLFRGSTDFSGDNRGVVEFETRF